MYTPSMHFGTTTAQFVTQVCHALCTIWFNVDPSSFILTVRYRKLGAVPSRQQLSPLPPLHDTDKCFCSPPPLHLHSPPPLPPLYTPEQRVATQLQTY